MLCTCYHFRVNITVFVLGFIFKVLKLIYLKFILNHPVVYCCYYRNCLYWWL